MNRIVITSIQAGTPSMDVMSRVALDHGWRLTVVGDRKTPTHSWPEPIDFLGISQQQELGFRLAALLPENHYARKNLGYLDAIAQRAACIFDTDDDNAPLESWRPRVLRTRARACKASGWVNAYSWFTDEHIWPRGLPLDKARHGAALPCSDEDNIEAPIQQGLANGSPDVDAVWRLLMDREITFREAPSVSLLPGSWCPFNSQSTWWFPAAYPLMYLPSFVSFRMTDIWRSFIAQRCLWAMGHGVVFHAAEMFQDRNEHNLLRDFEQEIPGYLANDRARTVLEALDLEPGADKAGSNLYRCYEALARASIVEARELPLVAAWLEDLAGLPGRA